MSAHSLRSAPAQNIGDVDRRSTTRTASSREEASAATSSSDKKASSRALRLSGRSSQSVRHPRSASTRNLDITRAFLEAIEKERDHPSRQAETRYRFRDKADRTDGGRRRTEVVADVERENHRVLQHGA
jgi:hypothetical protein